MSIGHFSTIPCPGYSEIKLVLNVWKIAEKIDNANADYIHIAVIPSNKIKNDLNNPIFMYVGRVAIEKNIEAFLELDFPGKKIIVGDGPSRKTLEKNTLTQSL